MLFPPIPHIVSFPQGQNTHIPASTSALLKENSHLTYSSPPLFGSQIVPHCDFWQKFYTNSILLEITSAYLPLFLSWLSRPLFYLRLFSVFSVIWNLGFCCLCASLILVYFIHHCVGKCSLFLFSIIPFGMLFSSARQSQPIYCPNIFPTTPNLTFC